MTPSFDARSLAAQELERLQAAEALGTRERLDYLADLGSRLKVLAMTLGGHGELSRLAIELEAAARPGADLDRLWRRAVEVLTALSDDGGQGGRPLGERQRSGRAFWKRA